MEPTRINMAVAKVQIDAESLREQNSARRMRGQPMLHECSICGHCAEWNDSWTWYGSVMDQDAGKVAKFCSAECMQTEPPDKTLFRVRRAT